MSVVIDKLDKDKEDGSNLASKMKMLSVNKNKTVE